jgi:16S rRNA processing protein RimM
LSETSPQIDPASAVSVGRIVAPHGLRGEVKVQPLTDFPERFSRGSYLWLDGSPRRVIESRWQGRLVCLKLEGVDTRTDAEQLRDKELMLPEAQDLAGSERYYLHDIVGLRVEDEAGSELGRVTDVLSTGANDVYVVRGERGELLLPAVEDVIKEIELSKKKLVVELLPGLEFRATEKGVHRPRAIGPKRRQKRSPPSQR